LVANGTAYAVGAPLYHQTNVFGEGWALWKGPGPPPTDFIPYAGVGSVYSQSFDSLPNPGAASVNSDNPVTKPRAATSASVS
jgi:hypothetical protein